MDQFFLNRDVYNNAKLSAFCTIVQIIMHFNQIIMIYVVLEPGKQGQRLVKEIYQQQQLKSNFLCD